MTVEGSSRTGDPGLEAAEAWLLSRELFGIRPGLERMRLLLQQLGDPQARFDAIHVVGSNGKTSTVAMAAALLERRGVRSGAYVSPHLVSFRERVTIAGEPATPEQFAGAVARVRRAAEALEAGTATPVDGGGRWAPGDLVTQFEAVTAAALLVLADAKVTCAVIEAGLGGRWDATNVLPPTAPDRRVAVLTSVSLEHTRWLGDSVEEIATEKVQVLRPGGTLVLADGLPAAARTVALAYAAAVGATTLDAPGEPGPDVPSPGAARYQRHNLATAIAAVDAYLGPDVARDPDAERDVAVHVVVPGRFEIVAGGRGQATVMHDGAHNEEGFSALADALDGAPPARPLVLLVGVLSDKDPAAMLAHLRRWCDAIVVTTPRNPRALPAAELAGIARTALPGCELQTAPDAHAGLDLARRRAGPHGTVLATGSLHLVADLRRGAGADPGASF